MQARIAEGGVDCGELLEEKDAGGHRDVPRAQAAADIRQRKCGAGQEQPRHEQPESRNIWGPPAPLFEAGARRREFARQPPFLAPPSAGHGVPNSGRHRGAESGDPRNREQATVEGNGVRGRLHQRFQQGPLEGVAVAEPPAVLGVFRRWGLRQRRGPGRGAASIATVERKPAAGALRMGLAHADERRGGENRQLGEREEWEPLEERGRSRTEIRRWGRGVWRGGLRS
mmetsp:Transcript_538/g.1103  ORF Transcript_538/g.1103 Transcript_538/m.1103 type:complete len:228 (+) Transcript_538:2650-3333(+)